MNHTSIAPVNISEVFETLNRNVTGGLIIIGTKGELLHSNTYFENIFGYNQGALNNKAIEVIIPKRFHSEYRQILLNLMERNELEGRVYFLTGLKKDGTEIPLEVSISIHSYSEKDIFLVALVSDISEQKDTELILNRKKEMYKSILEGTGDGFISFDFDYRCTYINEIAIHMLNGKEKSDFIGKYFLDTIPGMKESLEDMNLQRKINDRIQTSFDLYMPKRGRWLEIRTCYHNTGFAFIYRDITERRQRTEELRKSEERFSKSFHSSPIAQMITRADNRIFTDVNDRFLKLFGYNREEVIGEASVNFSPAVNIKINTVEKKIKLPLRKLDLTSNNEATVYTKNGTPVDILFSSENIMLNKNEHVLTTIVDISEKKKAEKELQRANEELESRVEDRTIELLQALEYEKELNEMKSRFVTMASHEFRTPLSTILSSIELIERYAKPENEDKRTKHIKRIKSSISNLVDILNDFLSLEKLEQNKIEILKNEFNLRVFSSDIADEMKDILKEGQKIIYTHKGEEIIIQDKRILKNIYLNLLSNAIKYSSENKNIQLQTEIIQNRIFIRIIDQGIGIPAEEQSKIFTKLFRANNASNIQGTGLGLSIVKRYVELLEGTIVFASQIDEGSTFTVQIDC